jgi:hypothetical protein
MHGMGISKINLDSARSAEKCSQCQFSPLSHRQLKLRRGKRPRRGSINGWTIEDTRGGVPMEADEQRRVENFAIVCPLQHIEDADMLAFVATLIQDHDHLREKLLTEPNVEARKGKLEAMRPYLHFKALSLETYMNAEAARQCGVHPIYAEAEKLERDRIWMPHSRVHEVH